MNHRVQDAPGEGWIWHPGRQEWIRDPSRASQPRVTQDQRYRRNESATIGNPHAVSPENRPGNYTHANLLGHPGHSVGNTAPSYPAASQQISPPYQTRPNPGAASSQTQQTLPGPERELVNGLGRIGLGESSSSRPSRHFEDNSSDIFYFEGDNGVKVLVQSGDNVPTDPKLQRKGVKASAYLRGLRDIEHELHFPNYRIRDHPKKFFKHGRVFSTLWSEPEGEGRRGKSIITELTSTSIGQHGQRIFSKLRRFIVIRPGHDSCSALAIMTYGNQGVAKLGVKKSEHGIVYMGKREPPLGHGESPERGEAGMVPTAIRVDPDYTGARLHPMSRINYAKVYTIEHNVKVRSVGTVGPTFLGPLVNQFENVWAAGVRDGAGPPLPPQNAALSLQPRQVTRGQAHVPAGNIPPETWNNPRTFLAATMAAGYSREAAIQAYAALRAGTASRAVRSGQHAPSDGEEVDEGDEDEDEDEDEDDDDGDEEDEDDDDDDDEEDDEEEEEEEEEYEKQVQRRKLHP